MPPAAEVVPAGVPWSGPGAPWWDGWVGGGGTWDSFLPVDSSLMLIPFRIGNVDCGTQAPCSFRLFLVMVVLSCASGLRSFFRRFAHGGGVGAARYTKKRLN